MSIYQQGVAVVFLVAMLASWGQTRRLAWLAASAAVFMATSWYWRAGLGNPAFISALADGAICLAIYAFGRQVWEMAIWRMFQSFVLVHMLFLMSTNGLLFAIDFNVYALVVEAINVLIVLTIGGSALLERLGHDGVYRNPWHPVYRLVRAVRAERAQPPFWKRWA